ncbi:retrovirus-related pol polyprotein from transposon TNT 1-94 [Tanacetum coccineum]
MDLNSSLEKICLGDNVIEISSEKIEGSGDWNSLEYQDTAGSKEKKVMNAFSFYRMETDEISERYIAPCFVNGLEAYDGEVNLAFDENLISNEFVVKLCLDYEVKKGKKLVTKVAIVALKGELYFVKFIINLEEYDFEPGVILGRSFLRLAKGVIDFGNGVIIIYPEPNPFEDDSEETGKSSDDWDQLLDFNIDDVPKFREELPPFVCKIGKSNRNKKRAMENLNLFYQDIGPSSSTVKEDEEAVKRIKGEALKEKDDPGAFIFPIRLEGKVNENTLADTGSDINTIPYQIFETLGREDMKKIDRGITMINHTQAEAMGKLSNVLCQVGVTTMIAKFLILYILIDHDAPIVFGRGFLYKMGSILNTPERLFSTFDRVCHQTFRAARFDVLRIAESDSDDEEEYVIKRNKFGAPIYGLKPALYLNCANPKDRSSAIQTVTTRSRKFVFGRKQLQEHTTEKPDRHDPNAQDNTKQWKNYYFHKFTTSFCYGKDVAEKLSLGFKPITLSTAKGRVYTAKLSYTNRVEDSIARGKLVLPSMRMEQYLTFIDHALWEVIVSSDSVSPVASASTGAKGPIPLKTAEQKLTRKNELKPKSTLMLAILDEHLLKFHACKDAKSLLEAIKNSQKGLDKTYDRFQKLISQLEIHGEVISQEDANLKLLRNLPSAWNNIALIMRNKSDLDTLSMDDLYNNLKVYESEIKGKSSSSSNSQNMAFVSSDNSSSTNETVNTTHSVSGASSKDQASTELYADDVIFSFFTNQSNAPQLDYEDLE